MSQIFENDSPNSDEESNFNFNNEYAKNYNIWRKKEEFNKLKTKYGDNALDEEESSSSSSDDEDGIELTEEVEKDFFKTLSCLKKKDPTIYNSNVNFFHTAYSNKDPEKKKKDKAVTLKDYERNLILERGGILSDDEEQIKPPRSPTYNEEQKQIKDAFKNIMNNTSDEEDDENCSSLIKKRSKTKHEIEQEESDYKQWLAGQTTELEDKDVEKDLKPLKDYWNNPHLEEGEKFLRDYILNKKYLEKENENHVPFYEEIVQDSDNNLSDDEEILEKQEEFEHKFNFRYEEPDQDFIKRYPRTMENSLRKTDDKRKLKRQEIKERKKREKEEKMQELGKLRELKRQEIEEKLEKLNEVAGTANLGFADEDIDGDFDPEEYDRKMQKLFNDDFYGEQVDEQKPEFPDLDEELEIENWERYNANKKDYQPHCEDEDFNMDADYDPSIQVKYDEDTVKNKKNRRKKSRFANAVSKPKPKFDPADERFEKYFEEYYKLDCEDIIGDIPCRFKYRKVVPNDFGLTTEEVLLANERELNKWCSLKKAVQRRPDEVEKYEQIAFKKKGENINLKRKILPSLFVQPSDETSTSNTDGNKNLNSNINNKTNVNSQSKNKNKKKIVEENQTRKETTEIDTGKELDDINKNNTNNENMETKVKKKKAKQRKIETEDIVKENTLDAGQKSQNDIVKKKKKKKKSKKQTNPVSAEEITNKISKDANNITKKLNKKKILNSASVENIQDSSETNKAKLNKKRKRKNIVELSNKKAKKQKLNTSEEKNAISDARLKSFGLNPKKYRNKIKYAKQVVI